MNHTNTLKRGSALLITALFALALFAGIGGLLPTQARAAAVTTVYVGGGSFTSPATQPAISQGYTLVWGADGPTLTLYSNYTGEPIYTDGTEGTLTIHIPAGEDVTVYGEDGAGASSSQGSGISVPNGVHLSFTGEGSLVASGVDTVTGAAGIVGTNITVSGPTVTGNSTSYSDAGVQARGLITLNSGSLTGNGADGGAQGGMGVNTAGIAVGGGTLTGIGGDVVSPIDAGAGQGILCNGPYTQTAGSVAGTGGSAVAGPDNVAGAGLYMTGVGVFNATGGSLTLTGGSHTAGEGGAGLYVHSSATGNTLGAGVALSLTGGIGTTANGPALRLGSQPSNIPQLTLNSTGGSIHIPGNIVIDSLNLTIYATLELTGTGSTTLSGDITGQYDASGNPDPARGGALIKTGTGTLTLSGDNLLGVGGYTINGGTLVAAGDNALRGDAPTTLGTGATLRVDNSGKPVNCRELTAAAGSTIHFVGGSYLTGAGTFSLNDATRIIVDGFPVGSHHLIVSNDGSVLTNPAALQAGLVTQNPAYTTATLSNAFVSPFSYLDVTLAGPIDPTPGPTPGPTPSEDTPPAPGDNATPILWAVIAFIGLVAGVLLIRKRVKT